MKPFQLDSSMTTLRGVFYPTGHLMLMLPSRQDALDAVRRLKEAGCDEETMSMLTPEVIMADVVHTVGSADMPLPSAGTEGDTVRRFAELASQGHHALLIHAPTAQESDRVVQALVDAPISYGQKYRHLVIEDIVA